jgi:DUF4097 and DUF4098 domain-containing protein YvlB
MIRRKWLKYTFLIAAAVFAMNGSNLSLQCLAQNRNLDCRDNWFSGGERLVSFCEIKEQVLPATGGVINVDGRKNGGISVKGWERNELLVRARIQAAAKTEAEARELAGQLRIQTAGGQIKADGPAGRDDSRWSVSYEIFVPFQSDLVLQTYNGGISITDVRGRMEFEALNGGVSLKRLAGQVRGSTTNGGLSVELSGDRWDGEGMDIKTTNGGVSISVPENYSAHLETSTVNGGLKVGFPVTVQGRINKEISVDLGSGGSTVRVLTTNGGVSIHRRGFE